MQSWFITGTDTDVGKTYVGGLLMQSLKCRGFSAIGYKPISAGCEQVGDERVNDDALSYQQLSTINVPLSQINPIAFMPPIAPHIAAEQAGEKINTQQLIKGYDVLRAYNPDVLITEGAGGWQLPLGNNVFMPSLPVACDMQVVLVVGLRLGCLNHALLTANAIKQDGAKFMGWIGNALSEDMPYQHENIQTLTQILGKPLALVPYKQEWTEGELRQLTEFMV